MARICDFMEVGETWNNLIRVSREGSEWVRRIRREDERSYPARTHHSCYRSQRCSSSSSCRIPAFHSGVWGKPEEDWLSWVSRQLHDNHNKRKAVRKNSRCVTVFRSHPIYNGPLIGFQAGRFTHHPPSSICGHVTVNLEGLALLSAHVDGVQTRGRLSIQQNLSTVLGPFVQLSNWKAHIKKRSSVCSLSLFIYVI